MFCCSMTYTKTDDEKAKEENEEKVIRTATSRKQQMEA